MPDGENMLPSAFDRRRQPTSTTSRGAVAIDADEPGLRHVRRRRDARDDRASARRRCSPASVDRRSSRTSSPRRTTNCDDVAGLAGCSGGLMSCCTCVPRRRSRVPSIATTLSPALQARACRALRTSRRASCVACSVAEVAGEEQHREHQHDRDDEVHRRTGARRRTTFGRQRLRAVRARLVLGRDLFEVGHADDAAVAAERDRLDAVLGLAPRERPEARAEADEELGDLHARALGRDEVAELVQHDDRRGTRAITATSATCVGNTSA